MGASPTPPEGAVRSAKGIRRTCLGAIALLYVFSIPWYRDPGDPLSLWLGMPDWVTVALLCYVAVAILNAVAWLLSEIPDVLPGEGTDAEPDRDASRPVRDRAGRRDAAGSA